MKFQIPMGELRRVAQLYPTLKSKRESFKDAKKIEGGIKLSDVNVGDWYLYSSYLLGVLYKDSKDNWIVIRDDWASPNYIRDTDAVNDRRFIIFTNIKGLRLYGADTPAGRPPKRWFEKDYWTLRCVDQPFGRDFASWANIKTHIKISSRSPSVFMNWFDETPLSSVK